MRPCNIPKKPKLLNHLQALAQTTKFMQEIYLSTPIRGKYYLEYESMKNYKHQTRQYLLTKEI